MNLQEETRNGYTISSQMKQIWSVQLQILKVLLEVCKKHDLKIWAASGTLLGCVREKGFIPWDDDIDMVMLREDYDKLMDVGPKEIKSPYFFQSAYTESVPYPRCHVQLRLDGTAAILPSGIDKNYHQGVFIDVFVLDTIPDDTTERNAFLTKIYQKRWKIWDWYIKPSFSFNMVSLYRNIRSLLFIKTHSFVKEYKKYECLLAKYKDKDYEYVAHLGLAKNPKHALDKKILKSCYDETIYLPFEDIELPVPKGYDSVLSVLYGDYMKPAKTPTAHGGFLVLDTQKSYKDYLEEIRREKK